MTNYREILRLSALGFSQQNIAYSCNVSKKTVNRILRKAQEANISWPLDNDQTNAVLATQLFPMEANPSTQQNRRMPDFNYIHKELKRNGVTKRLLWIEYLEECRLNDEEPLMYSRFCYYIQKDEEKRRASMHINRKPGEQAEVDWAGDPAYIIDPLTGQLTKVFVFVGSMSYSQHSYAEAFLDEKQRSWLTAHIHMFEYFGAVPRIIVPDNCKTAVIRKGNSHYDPRINESYRDLAEHYGTAIIPARVRKPKDKPNAEGSVRHVSTWIIAALRNEQFFSLDELNQAIREKLDEINQNPFQKKEGNRLELFTHEELPVMASLPATRYELADWASATVLFNYHISFEGMLYSVPSEYIKHKVDVRATEHTIQIFYKQERIATHKRLYGRKGQYSTITEHMPPDHQQYLEWNGDRFRNWAKQIGANTYNVIDNLLTSSRVEQQTYRGCMGILKLADKYSNRRLEAACTKALSFTGTPSYRSIKTIITSSQAACEQETESTHNSSGITRGADYYRR